MKNIREEKFRKDGLRIGLEVIINYFDSIEIYERSASRRYKLLKQILIECYNNTQYVLEENQIPCFKYKFEKGDLIKIDDE